METCSPDSLTTFANQKSEVEFLGARTHITSFRLYLYGGGSSSASALYEEDEEDDGEAKDDGDDEDDDDWGAFALIFEDAFFDDEDDGGAPSSIWTDAFFDDEEDRDDDDEDEETASLFNFTARGFRLLFKTVGAMIPTHVLMTLTDWSGSL
jgi:hypothetical protein